MDKKDLAHIGKYDAVIATSNEDIATATENLVKAISAADKHATTNSHMLMEVVRGGLAAVAIAILIHSIILVVMG